METKNIKIDEIHLNGLADKHGESLGKKMQFKGNVNSEDSIIGRYVYGTPYGNEVVKSYEKKNFLEKMVSRINLLFLGKNDVKTSKTDDESINSYEYSDIHKYNSIDDIEYMQYAQNNHWFEKVETQSRMSKLLSSGLNAVAYWYRNSGSRNSSKSRKSNYYLAEQRRNRSNQLSEYTEAETSQNSASDMFTRDMELLTLAIKPQNFDDDLSSLSSVDTQDSIASVHKTTDKNRYQRKLDSKNRNLINRRASF